MAFENLCLTLSETGPEDLKALRKVKVMPVDEKPEVFDLSTLLGDLFSKAVSDIVLEAEKLQLAAKEK